MKVKALLGLIAAGWLLVWALYGGQHPAGAAGRTQEGKRQPNVLFIAVDDLNDWVGPLKGHPQTLTPNIDRLAKRGTLFTRAYCAAPSCNPSRAALLSGRRPSTTGVYDNNQPWRPVLKDVVTLPEHFRANGYYVAAGGKIFHNSYNDPSVWDTYYKRPGDPLPPHRPVNGIPKAAQFDWGPLDVPDEAMGDYKLVQWAKGMLNESRDKPLFLGVGFIKPHLPWYVPRKYFDLHPLDKIQLPPTIKDDLSDVPMAGRAMARSESDHKNVLEARQWEKAVQGYLASISWLDTCVGQLLDALEQSPRGRDTLIVFWGDHGWQLGEKEHWRKFALWEEANRMPLIFAGPGIKPNRRCDRPVNLMDLYPTLIDLCRLTARDGLEGRSIAPLLADPNRKWPYASLSTYHRGNHSIRTGRWRYIRYAAGSEELYDHDADPREWTNLAGKPEFASVKKELAVWLPKTDAPEAPKQKEPPMDG